MLFITLLLASLAFTSFATKGQVCPANDGKAVSCDNPSHCFNKCCLSSCLCPAPTCVSLGLSLGASGETSCQGDCLKEVSCIPLIPTCRANSSSTEHCMGTVRCINKNCGGQQEGAICLYNSLNVNVQVCLGVEIPQLPVCVMEIVFQTKNLLFSLVSFLLNLLTLCPGMHITPCAGFAESGKHCLTVSAIDLAHVANVPSAVVAIVGYLRTLPLIDATSVVTRALTCNQ